MLALRGQVKRGAAWILGAIFSFVLITAVLIPSFRTIGSGSAFLGTFYGWLGDTPFEILKTLLTRPVHVVETVLSEHQGATWLRKMMLPLGMLFLLAPEFLLALLPEAAVLLLSSLWMMRSTLWHYPSISLCVLAIGAVGGLGRLHRWATAPTGHPAVLRLASIGWRLRLIPMAIAVLLSVHYLYQDGCTFPFLKRPRKWGYYQPEMRQAQFQRAAALVPLDATVGLPGNLLHPLHPFKDHRLACVLPDRVDVADYVVLDTRTRYYYEVFFERGQDKTPQQMFDRIRRSPEHELIYSDAGLNVYRRLDFASRSPHEREQRWILTGPALP